MKEIISQTESKLETYFKRKLKSEKRKWAEDESVKMFGKNLKSLLLTKPIRIKEKSRLVLKIFLHRYYFRSPGGYSMLRFIY